MPFSKSVIKVYYTLTFKERIRDVGEIELCVAHYQNIQKIQHLAFLTSMTELTFELIVKLTSHLWVSVFKSPDSVIIYLCKSPQSQRFPFCFFVYFISLLFWQAAFHTSVCCTAGAAHFGKSWEKINFCFILVSIMLLLWQKYDPDGLFGRHLEVFRDFKGIAQMF